MAKPRQRIVPSVQDRKNALLLQPSDAELTEGMLATLQHALLRGIEAAFQLEEGEILAEPMPSRDARAGFLFYEAAEGGAGVLSRLVGEPDALAKVAREALALMHFSADGITSGSRDAGSLRDVEGTECVAACYRCLMSYYNQPDHELLDRRDKMGREILLRLARATMKQLAWRRPSANPPPLGDVDGTVARLIALADAAGLPRPDVEPLATDGTTIPLVWRAHYVAAFIGTIAPSTRDALDSRGFALVMFSDDHGAWERELPRLAAALGQAR
jgi:hypothetical protein